MNALTLIRAHALDMRARWVEFLESPDDFPPAEFWNALDELLTAAGAPPPDEPDGAA